MPPEPEAVALGDRLALSPGEAAALTGLDVDTLRREIQAGRLLVKRVGRRVLIPRARLDQWLMDQEEEVPDVVS